MKDIIVECGVTLPRYIACEIFNDSFCEYDKYLLTEQITKALSSINYAYVTMEYNEDNVGDPSCRLFLNRQEAYSYIEQRLLDVAGGSNLCDNQISDLFEQCIDDTGASLEGSHWFIRLTEISL